MVAGEDVEEFMDYSGVDPAGGEAAEVDSILNCLGREMGVRVFRCDKGFPGRVCGGEDIAEMGKTGFGAA